MSTDDKEIQGTDEKKEKKGSAKLGCAILAGLFVFILLGFGLCVALSGGEPQTQTQTDISVGDKLALYFGDMDGVLTEDEMLEALVLCTVFKVDDYSLSRFRANVELGQHGIMGPSSLAGIESAVSVDGVDAVRSVCTQALDIVDNP